MKLLFTLFSFSCFLWGASVSTQITFIGEPAISIRTITQAFNSIGYKLDIELLSVQSTQGELKGKAVGNKVFNAAVLGENLKEQGIRIHRANFGAQGLVLFLDTQNASWNVPLLGSDEGSELKKVNSAQWFRIEEGQHIRIEPPYTGKWYPDVAVLDAKMEVLSSFRSAEPKDELEFALPAGAYYLRVSNAPGMKVLKEGMWIESMSPGR